MDLNAVRVFLKVAQAGSFVQAARLLGMPSSTVSAKVSALERRLGVTLIRRTTRKLHLTPEGEDYFRHGLRALDELQGIEARIGSVRKEPEGILRVTAPVDLGNSCLVALSAVFQKKYPKMALEFDFNDRRVDLVAEGIDVAIRAGTLQDSALVARKLGMAHWVPFASPEYLKKEGRPVHPKDLAAHTCLRFTPLVPMADGHWQLSRGGTSVRVPTGRSAGANDMNFTKGLCLAGMGIALLPTFATAKELKAGELVRVLPEWRANSDPVHLVHAPLKHPSPGLRAFTELAVEEFEKILKA